MQVEFTKPEGGGLGFALVGGTNGSILRVKEICSGGVAEQDGRLRVGDILLEVTTDRHCMTASAVLVLVFTRGGGYIVGERRDCVWPEPQ